MAYTLDQIRVYVRNHLDLDETELTNSLLDVWCRDATIKIARSRKRWPFLEEEWTLTTTASVKDYDLTSLALFDPAVDEIVSVVHNDRRLSFLGRDEAERAYLPNTSSTGTVTFYNTWNDKLRFYPTPNSADTLQLRGYRKVTDWVASGAGAFPDFPDEFHDAIRLYVVAMAYLQQEDADLAKVFISAFDAEMDLLKKQFGDAPGAYPLVLGAGIRGRGLYGRLQFPFE